MAAYLHNVLKKNTSLSEPYAKIGSQCTCTTLASPKSRTSRRRGVYGHHSAAMGFPDPLRLRAESLAVNLLRMSSAF